MKWKMKCWWKDLPEDLSPGRFQIVMLWAAHVVDQLHLACKPLITLLAPVPEIMNDDISTLVHLQMVWGKERKTFFLPQTKIEANKILKPYPCFLSHSNFSTFFRVTTSMSSTTWNIFTKKTLFSYLVINIGFISKLSIFLQLYLFCFPSPGLNTPSASAIGTTCRWRRSSQSLTLGAKTMIIFGGRK